MTGAEIRAFRERHGLTGEEFGKLVEPPITRFVVSALENGRRISAGMRARLMLAMRARPAGE
jgi:DNA-binding transcriptional regulator YiaG